MARQVYVVDSDEEFLRLATRPDGPPAFLLRRADIPAVPAPEPGQAPAPPRDVPPMSPREIQARLRGGETVAQVAAESGLPAARVETFAAPVLSERARVLDDARAAVMSRPFAGPSRRPLGAAVVERWAAVVGDGDGRAAAWSARRDPDGSWVVSVDLGDGASAAWRWDRAHRSLVPLDEVAAALGFVPPTVAAARAAADNPALRGGRSGAGPGGQAADPSEGQVGGDRDRAADDQVAQTASGTVTGDTAGDAPHDEEAAEAPAAADRSEAAPADPEPGGAPSGPSPRLGPRTRSRRAAVPAWADVLMGVSEEQEPPERPPGQRPGSGSR